MNPDDALAHLVSTLQSGNSLEQFGYEVYLERVMWDWISRHERGIRDSDVDQIRARRFEELSPAFFVAAWELCRRGILRPGVRRWGAQPTEPGSGGGGYCLTPFGREWLREADTDALAAVIPARFVGLLQAHAKRFGAGYLARGAEAINCYNAHAYLACCAMCGASAESILLALACEVDSEAEVLDLYRRAGGRSKVQNLIVGKAADSVKREFQGFMVLLNYWRDEAAHGRASNISETEAFTSLMLLLRLARYADETF